MKNLIYADNIYLIGDMGKMVQICNFVKLCKVHFWLDFLVYICSINV